MLHHQHGEISHRPSHPRDEFPQGRSLDSLAKCRRKRTPAVKPTSRAAESTTKIPTLLSADLIGQCGNWRRRSGVQVAMRMLRLTNYRHRSKLIAAAWHL